jgi:hypothetical protein
MAMTDDPGLIFTDELQRLHAVISARDAEIERLRKGIQDFLDGNYDTPRRHRPAPCKHGMPYYHECSMCNDEHFANLLKG